MKSILKKVLGIALTASLALGMIGCSNGSSDDSTSGSSDNFTGTGNFNYSSSAVGDFILKDGSILSKTEEPESGSVIAIIVRAAAGGKPALGMGIDQQSLAWCNMSTTYFETYIPELVGSTTDGYTDGSDSWEKLIVACPNASLDDFPAWKFVRNYATDHGLSGTLATGWYFPTVAELYTIWQSKGTVEASLTNINASTFGTYQYWSCCQSELTEGGPAYIKHCAPILKFEDGSQKDTFARSSLYYKVCAVRAFN